ncbi:hypothetical protein PMAYCL1PPCAC_05879, partial [Pristionchus mayeri]
SNPVVRTKQPEMPQEERKGERIESDEWVDQEAKEEVTMPDVQKEQELTEEEKKKAEKKTKEKEK